MGSKMKEKLQTGTKITEKLQSGTNIKEKLQTGTKIKEKLQTGTKIKEKLQRGTKIKERLYTPAGRAWKRKMVSVQGMVATVPAGVGNQQPQPSNVALQYCRPETHHASPSP